VLDRLLVETVAALERFLVLTLALGVVVAVAFLMTSKGLCPSAGFFLCGILIVEIVSFGHYVVHPLNNWWVIIRFQLLVQEAIC